MQVTPLYERYEHPSSSWSRGSHTSDSQFVPMVSATKRATLGSASVGRQRVAAVAAFLVGTGGLITTNYVEERDQRGYRFNSFEYRARPSVGNSNPRTVPTPTENLARVRSVFNPSVTELASLFGVSRQTIYNWQGGQPIAELNAERLEQLAVAANILSASGPTISTLLRRKISRGKTFLELVKEGGAPAEIAQDLVGRLQHEADERARLTQRLGARASYRANPEEIGVPHVREET